MKIEFFYSPKPRTIEAWEMELTSKMTLEQCLPSWALEAVRSGELTLAVWGRSVELSYPVQADDRVMLLRPLRVDPLIARRERFNQQGVKKPGLFKNKRKSAKQGY